LLKYAVHKKIAYTPNMPWFGDLIIQRNIFTNSDFTSYFDLMIEKYGTIEDIPSEIWDKIKENDKGIIEN
jgi:hypothetical protein